MKAINGKTMRKIIHIDMDCFYAAIEMRDDLSLRDKPIAVGGSKEERGVICTANYLARQYGVRSAMATVTAQRLCKDLILLPVNMSKYREVAKRIDAIFRTYTDLVEPLSLDEAYLDVSYSNHHQGSATLIAQAIRNQILETEELTASAGVASNKFLAKVASGWRKPNGLFVIRPNEIENFIKTLPIDELYGVGKVTAEKLYSKNIKNCTDLQKLSLMELVNEFGKLGKHLFEQCRGIDHRPVEANRERKSLSVEHTFPQDINSLATCFSALEVLYNKLKNRIQENAPYQSIKNQSIKIKFSNFRQISCESCSNEVNLEIYQTMLRQTYVKIKLPVRLIGLGVHFDTKNGKGFYQQSFL